MSSKRERDWKIMKHIYYLPNFREISLTPQIASAWAEEVNLVSEPNLLFLCNHSPSSQAAVSRGGLSRGGRFYGKVPWTPWKGLQLISVPLTKR